MWELEEGELMRFRCRVGHAFSPAAMVEAESDLVETALWQSARALKESAAVCRRVAQRTGRLEELSKRAEERERLSRSAQRVLQKGAYDRDSLLRELRAVVAAQLQPATRAP